jgi:ABC-type sugar transport system permease subunit
MVISQFIYRKGFEENNFGYASAASVVLFLLCIIVTIVQFLWNQRKSAR